MAVAAGEQYPAVIKYWTEVLNDKRLSHTYRMQAASELMNRAFGKPPQAIAAPLQQSTKQRILEVRWLPPDPNDHSEAIDCNSGSASGDRGG
jgi:hypothetical protein